METEITGLINPQLRQWYKEKNGRNHSKKALTSLNIIGYADDFVIIHENEEIIAKAKQLVGKWLKGIGLGMFEPT